MRIAEVVADSLDQHLPAARRAAFRPVPPHPLEACQPRPGYACLYFVSGTNDFFPDVHKSHGPRSVIRGVARAKLLGEHALQGVDELETGCCLLLERGVSGG